MQFFVFRLFSVFPLLPPSEVKSMLRYQRRCGSEVSAASRKQNRLRSMTFTEPGTRPEPQTHTHTRTHTHTFTFETHDLMWERGHGEGHAQLCRRHHRCRWRTVLSWQPGLPWWVSIGEWGGFLTYTSPPTHTVWGQFGGSSRPNGPVFGPGETHLRRSGLE